MSLNPPSIDTLISPALKDLRECWWDDEFTEFLTETLRPRPGNRILDVGCGPGTAEVSIGRLHLSQIRLVGIDLRVDRVITARAAAASHNLRAAFAAADAGRLPFASGVFDSTYCVAVMQHISDVDSAVGECARVTRPHGRVVVVEPDNAARYAYSSSSAGMKAFATAASFFTALADVRGDATDASIGPKLPTLFARHGIEPDYVRLFPVSHVRIGAPESEVWAARRAVVERALEFNLTEDPTDRTSLLERGAAHLAALAAYEADARTSGPSFVEIQNTMLFATVGQRIP
ncbi:MAG: methyltransferase domain-containing protein [Vicinamibacterales bacterium]